jgi:hypothetical protein
LGKARAHLRGRYGPAGKRTHSLDDGGAQIVFGVGGEGMERTLLVARDAACAEQKELELVACPRAAGEPRAFLQLVEAKRLQLQQ